MHEYVPRLPGQLLLSDVDEELSESSRLSELARNRDRARRNLEKSQANAKRLYDGKHKVPNFRIGDTFYCTMGHRSSTLDPNFDGPYEVTELLGENAFKIKRAPKSHHRLKERVVNVEQLRRHATRDINVPELGDSIIAQMLRQGADPEDANRSDGLTTEEPQIKDENSEDASTDQENPEEADRDQRSQMKRSKT